MESPTLVYRKTLPLTYDIVVERWNSTRILIYLDGANDEVSINYRDRELYIIVTDRETLETRYLHMKLWFKIKHIEYRLKNGIMTLDIKGKRFFFI